MDKLSALIAVVALGLGGYAMMQVGEKSERIEQLEVANQELRDRLVTLETESGSLGSDAPAGLREAGAAKVIARASDGTPIGLKGRPASPIDRLAALEKRVAEQNEQLAKMEAEKAEEAKAHGSVRNAMGAWSRDKFYGNLDMAAKAMELNERQKSDMQDLIDRAQRELQDLYKIENDEGVTWNDVRKPKMVEGSGFSIALPDMGKIAKFKKGRIPGSSETFGDAEKRIRKDAFGRMRNLLTPEQTTKWDKARKEPLLSGGGGVVSAVSFVGVDSDD